MNSLPPDHGFIVDIEHEVLGTLLGDGDFRRISGILEERHFVEDLHRRLFNAIRSSFETYGTTRVSTVVKLIPADVSSAVESKLSMSITEYLSFMVTNTLHGNAGLEKNARHLIAQQARISLAEEAGRLQAAATDPAADAIQLVTHAGMVFDDILSDLRRGPKRRTLVTLSDASANAFEAAREAINRGSGLTGATWGLADINRLTGGIQRRDLTLIGARPSMGKTTVGLSVAINAAKAGAGVGFISLEMDSDKLAARAITDIAYDQNVKVPYQSLLNGRIDKADVEALEVANQNLRLLPLWIEDQSGLSITDIRIKIESLMIRAEKIEKKLDVLVIDHLGLIKASNRYSGNRNNEIAEMTAALKSMAREYNLAIIALSQLNRGLEQQTDKRPQLSSLRDSGAIEQDADTIIFLYREAYYLIRAMGTDLTKDAERHVKLLDCQNKLEFQIAKQRNGPVANIELFVDIGCSAVRNAGRA